MEPIFGNTESSVKCPDCGGTYKNKHSLHSHRSQTCKKRDIKPQVKECNIIKSVDLKNVTVGSAKPKRAYNRTAPLKMPKAAPPKTKRKRRCGECDACRNVDCMKCKFCLDMKKYGGNNLWKRPCELRICGNMMESHAVKTEPQQDDDDIFDSDDEAYWKEFCEA